MNKPVFNKYFKCFLSHVLSLNLPLMLNWICVIRTFTLLLIKVESNIFYLIS